MQAESQEKDAGCCSRHTGNHLHLDLSLDQDVGGVSVPLTPYSDEGDFIVVFFLQVVQGETAPL